MNAELQCTPSPHEVRYLINMCRGRQVDVHANLIAQCRFWPGVGVCPPRPRNTHECKRVLERLLEKSRYDDNASGLKSSCKMISTGNMRWISCMSSSARQAQPLKRTRHAMRGPTLAESELEAVQRPRCMHRPGWTAHLAAQHGHEKPQRLGAHTCVYVSDRQH